MKARPVTCGIAGWLLAISPTVEAQEILAAPLMPPAHEPADEPQRWSRGLRFEGGAGTSLTTIFDTPVFTGGARVALGHRIEDSGWVLYATGDYHGGATEHGLAYHRGAVGFAAVYNVKRFRFGVGPEFTYSALIPFTGRPASLWDHDHYGGLGGGVTLSAGYEFIQNEDGAMFVEVRSGGRIDLLVDNLTTWTPGSLWIGGRYGQ